MHDRVPTLAVILALAAAYAATGMLGLSAASVGNNVTLLWAPTGLSLGALVLFGPRAWPGVALGAFLVNLWAGVAGPVALGIAAGNTLEAIAGAWLLRQRGFRPGLARLEDVGSFLLALAAAPVIAAGIGVGALFLGGATPGAEVGHAAVVWWLGDATGALVVAPVLLTWTEAGWTPASRARAAPLETAALVSATALAGVAAFVVPNPLALVATTVPFLVVFGAALRQGLALASALTAGTAGLAVLGAVRGVGPFVRDGVPDLGMTWAYVAVLGCTTLVLAALLAELRAALDRQRELESKALESQRLESLGLIAAGVAHDFNNLLQVVLGHAMMARERGGDPADLDPIVDAAEQAAALCDQLLTYAGQAPARAEPLDLARQTEAVAGLLRVGLPPGVGLDLRLDAQPVVSCDPSQLRQVLMNLVTNAAEAARDAGGGRVELRTGTQTLDAAALAELTLVGPGTVPGEFGFVEVVDHGPGMTAEVRARVFEPFFSTRFHGRGLGLAALAGVVRTHGGFVRLQTAPGEGTRFRVGFPRTHEPPAATAPRPTRVAAPSDTTLLVVDDDPAVREVITRTLRRAGHRVVEAEDGEAALARCREHPEIGGVLLDWAMPGMDGLQTLRSLRELRPGLRIAMCSGWDERHASEASDMRPDLFLQKPFRAEALRDTAQRLLTGGPPDTPGP